MPGITGMNADMKTDMKEKLNMHELTVNRVIFRINCIKVKAIKINTDYNQELMLSEGVEARNIPYLLHFENRSRTKSKWQCKHNSKSSFSPMCTCFKTAFIPAVM